MESYIKLFNRDLTKLKNEIEQFEPAKNLWVTRGNITNTAGNLCLHIAGNLNHFIGAMIGNSEYVRDREAEFSQKDISRDSLLELVDETEKAVSEVLHGFDPADLSSIYPVLVFGEEMTFEFFLMHLLGHLNYHLGQINYLRRML